MADLVGIIQVGESVTVTVTKTYKQPIPSFIMMGYKRGHSKVEALDLLKIIEDDLSHASTRLFMKFIRIRNPDTNLAVYTPETPTLRKELTRAHSELSKLELVIRVAPHTYLINPRAFIPTVSKYPDVQKEWDKELSKLKSKPVNKIKGI